MPQKIMNAIRNFWVHQKSRNPIGRIIDVVLLVFIGFLLWQRIPMWREQNAFEGQQAPVIAVEPLLAPEGHQFLRLPLRDEKPSVLIFWATWCGPCKVELARFKSAIEAGELPAERIFAVSMGESRQTVQEFQEKENLPFALFIDPQYRASKNYPIPGTPTVIHIDKANLVKWVGTGISPTGIMRAKNLFVEP